MKIFKSIKENIDSIFRKYINKSIKNLPIENLNIEKKINVEFINFSRFDNEYINELDLSATINSVFEKENINSNEKNKILLKIYMDSLKIHQFLLPLVSLGIVYSIDVIGGSIRDFLLNKQDEIKDLDILVTLSNSFDNKHRSMHDAFSKTLISSELIKKNWCTKEELEKVNFIDNEEIYKKQNKLLDLCLNRNTQINFNKVFSESERKVETTAYGDDILNDLNAIIKIENDSLNYPIDLLITNHKDKFFSQIDFGICNIGFKVVDLNKNLEMKLIDLFDVKNNVVNSFFTSVEFLEDVKNKTITFNTFNKTMNQLEYSFNSHLNRIEKKYPDYNLVLPKYISEEVKNNINTIILKSELERKLINSKIDKPNIKKI